jgi:hypothetical protein
MRMAGCQGGRAEYFREAGAGCWALRPDTAYVVISPAVADVSKKQKPRFPEAFTDPFTTHA